MPTPFAVLVPSGKAGLIRCVASERTERPLDPRPDGPRRVTWIHRNAAGDETGREEDPTDTYDPRTRPWYEGALANGHLFWTGIYVFFSQRVPGITASTLRASLVPVPAPAAIDGPDTSRIAHRSTPKLAWHAAIVSRFQAA